MGLHNGEGEKRGGGLLSCNISPLRPPPLANLVGASERAEAAVASGLLCDASAGRGERPPANRDRPTDRALHSHEHYVLHVIMIMMMVIAMLFTREGGEGKMEERRLRCLPWPLTTFM